MSLSHHRCKESYVLPPLGKIRLGSLVGNRIRKAYTGDTIANRNYLTGQGRAVLPLLSYIEASSHDDRSNGLAPLSNDEQ
jgi:hypothetical protein